MVVAALAAHQHEVPLIRRMFSADAFVPCCGWQGLTKVLRSKSRDNLKVAPAPCLRVSDLQSPGSAHPAAPAHPDEVTRFQDEDDVSDEKKTAFAFALGDATVVPPWRASSATVGEFKRQSSGCFEALSPGDGCKTSKAAKGGGSPSIASVASKDSISTRSGGSAASDQSFGAASMSLSEPDVTAAMDRVVDDIKPWPKLEGSFGLVRTLEQAEMNHGRVDLMTRSDGRRVAVKRMPATWVGTGPQAFRAKHPTASEQPWHDMGLVKALNELRFPYTAELLGVFSSDTNMYVVTSLATRGDLFSWCFKSPGRGQEREIWMRPMFRQVFTAVRWLHELGLAHRDLSLENMLVSDVGAGAVRVQIIDFGMSTLTRFCKAAVRGKRSYQAPEMHALGTVYDAFLSDAFAIGVTLYIMAIQDYPWAATRVDKCELFCHASKYGLKSLLRKRKLRKGNGLLVADAFSPAFLQLLEGLLDTDPEARHTLGESCFSEQDRTSLWDSQWAKGLEDGTLENSPQGTTRWQSRESARGAQGR